MLDDFKKKYLKYDQRFDLVLHSRGDYYTEHTYKVYDKYDFYSENSIFGLEAQQAHIVARRLNEEDESYLKQIYHYTRKLNQE